MDCNMGALNGIVVYVFVRMLQGLVEGLISVYINVNVMYNKWCMVHQI